MAKPDNELLQALSACVVHARDLVEAAKAVQSTGRSNIAYHLATLALEESGGAVSSGTARVRFEFSRPKMEIRV
jgi:AbiV family abortive infection protein